MHEADEATNMSYTPGKSSYGSGCTEALVTGLTSLKGNMNGQNVDSMVGMDMWPGFFRLVIPEEGNRYIVAGEGDFFVLVNEKGLCWTGGFRPAKTFPPYSGTPEYLSRGELARISDSAAEYVELWSKNFTKYGTPGGSVCTLIVDPKEGYLLEGANFVYGDPANHNIQGPMTDQVFVSGNFFVSERLKGFAEAGIGAGYTRAKRMWELLIDRQYDCSVMQPSPPAGGGGISLPYFMSCWRDHGDIPPEEGRMSAYVPEERGEGVLCAHGITEYTSNAYIGVAREDHTNLLSCAWVTPSQPCISPFLPLYIGINEVPKALGTTEAFNLFEELRLSVERHPRYRQKITQHWTIFEIQVIEESYGVEKNSVSLAEGGDLDGARDVLTEFCEKKCAEALAAAKDMLKFLNKLPILGKTAVEADEE
jgi:hypothetical protein